MLVFFKVCKMTLQALFFIFSVSFCFYFVVNASLVVREGVIFEKQSDVVIRSEDYNVVVQIDISSVLRVYQSLDQQLKKLDQMLQTPDSKFNVTSNIYGGLFSVFDSNLEHFRDEIRNMENAVPRPRLRRWFRRAP